MSKILKAVSKNSGSIYIFKPYKENIGYSCYVVDKIFSRPLFRQARTFDWENGGFELSIPSQQEIDHLEACIKAGKYVPIEEITINKEFSYEVW